MPPAGAGAAPFAGAGRASAAPAANPFAGISQQQLLLLFRQFANMQTTTSAGSGATTVEIEEDEPTR